MDPALNFLRDGLIARKNGAVKYQPIIEDMVREEIAALKVKPEEVAGIMASIIAKVQAREAEIQALADAEHAKFISQVRAEITIDPDGRGYSGMTAEQIAAEMQREIPIEVEQPTPTEMSELVRGVLDACTIRDGIAVGPDGRVLDSAGLQALIDAAIAESKKTAGELSAPRTQTVVVGAKPAPCWRVITGVKYGRNVVRVEEIEEALR